MKRIRRFFGNLVFVPPALVSLLFRSFRLWWEFRVFRRQELVIKICRQPVSRELKRQRVLVAITHVVSEQEAKAGAGADVKLERLVRTLDAAMLSFAHCDLEIILNTCPGRHIAAALPTFMQRRVKIIEQAEIDPLYVGHLVPDIFEARREDFDWFLYLEDDIILHDSYALEKLMFFNRATGDPLLLLTPHIFEMYKGEKYYINLLWPDFKKSKECDWNRFTTFSVNGITFGECNKPYCACFCLNREQLEIWERSGRRWRHQHVYAGVPESAAGFCLFEVFTLFKPHRDNLHFFEVQHWDTKYSRIVVANEELR